ncbi:hypothetical protein GPN2_23335 [Streptomyces murinus]
MDLAFPSPSPPPPQRPHHLRHGAQDPGPVLGVRVGEGGADDQDGGGGEDQEGAEGGGGGEEEGVHRGVLSALVAERFVAMEARLPERLGPGIGRSPRHPVKAQASR